MSRELLLLRHAKSDWDATYSSDFERPLAKRGKRDAPKVGAWLYREGLVPERIVSSPALRARDTTLKICKAIDYKKKHICWEPRLYEASQADLIHFLQQYHTAPRCFLVVGHNPGLEDVVRYLAGADFEEPADGKLLPTAAMARLEMPDDWRVLAPGCATLLSITRPRLLEDQAA